MRYSFHGKVRATGQQVDGFVEANSSTEAIDRLADQGIIGVYTVRPEAKRPKNSVVFSGQESVEEDEPAAPTVPAALPAPAPVPQAQAAAAPKPGRPVQTNPAVLQQLVDQIQVLTAQVEKLLARPAQVVYQSGPARGGGEGRKKSARIFDDAQNSTLRDIFQNNLDLRKSLEKLASTSGPKAPEAAAREIPGAGPKPPTSREMPKNGSNGREHPMQAQPAA